MGPVGTCCLAGVVLLSLVLSLGAAALRDRRRARLRYEAIWIGQGCLATAGLLILAAPALAGLGLALAAVGCAACGRAFRCRARLTSGS